MRNMHRVKCYSSLLTLLSLIGVSCSLQCSKPARTIIVDQSNSGRRSQVFNTIQSAINSIPSQNTRWIHMLISAGTYTEKVTIPTDKPCIFLEGAGSPKTRIEWNDHEQTNTSPTFTSFATDIVAKGISFVNTYNHPPRLEVKAVQVKQAVAALILGDRTAFYECAFKGVQDTLWDASGRHYFYNCYIQGAVDFIFGNGQSIYEKTTVNYAAKSEGLQKEFVGFITAHGRTSMSEATGFVFKDCKFTGNGKTYLGRAWRPHARVIIAISYIADVIEPLGWNAWNGTGHEENLVFVEEVNRGPGANKLKRVPWIKHMRKEELAKFLIIPAYIDQEGWISKLPNNS